MGESKEVVPGDEQRVHDDDGEHQPQELASH